MEQADVCISAAAAVIRELSVEGTDTSQTRVRHESDATDS